MEFAVAIVNTHFPTFIERVRLAEALGFDRICFGDSQSVLREAWVSQAVMARETTRAGLWMTVTNPVTRHPAVIASACSTMAELSGGRFVLGLGTGDSALYNIGAKAVTVDTLRKSIETLRALWRGEAAEWEGKTARIVWDRASVPVSISAEGPRTLRLAGEVCDEVCVGSGLDETSVRWAKGLLAEGAATAGRTVEDLKVWFFAKCAIADSREDAIDQIKMALASSANHAFRSSFEGKSVPARLQPLIRELQEGYAFSKHTMPGENPNRDLVADPELLEFLVDRFALAGTPEQIVDQLRGLHAMGVDNVFLTAIAPDPTDLVTRFANEVMPRLR